MNTWQIARQVRKLLSDRVWEGTGGKVFGAVRVTNGLVDSAVANLLAFPIALIRVGDGDAEDQLPGHITRGMEVFIMQKAAGDQVGENAMIGANRASQGASQGRGLLELEEEVHATLRELMDSGGVRSIFKSAAMAAPEWDENAGMTTAEVLKFEMDATDTRYYHPPQDLMATGGVGSVSLTWTLPPARFDRYRVRLIRKAGASAPANVADGTEVALSGPLATSKTDTVAAGTYSYTIFASYDETNIPPSADQRTSEVETGSFRAGVVVS